MKVPHAASVDPFDELRDRMAREFDIPAVVGANSLPLHLDGRQGELTVDRLH